MISPIGWLGTNVYLARYPVLSWVSSEKAAVKKVFMISLSSNGTRRTTTRCWTLLVGVSTASISERSWSSISRPVNSLIRGAKATWIVSR